MSAILRMAVVLLLLVSFGHVSAAADEPRAPGEPGPGPGATIAWKRDVTAAIEAAKASKRFVMVCINMARVDGRKDEEPAAKGLREVVYRDARVVEKAREFECVLLTKEEGATDYDPLRKLGVEGTIVSPQHLFVHPDGTRIVLRKEYWPHGSGEKAVEALLSLMREAQTDPGKAGAAAGAAGGPPEDAEGRAKWIADRVRDVGGEAAVRDAALALLAKHDRDGDCLAPLLALLPGLSSDVPTLRAVVRALGRNALEAAALPLADLLTHDEATIRANAAVSLEYVGSPDKKVVAALLRTAGKEKDAGVANHAFRALGRCGAGDARVRGALLERATSAKSEFASYGACIGLAYFEGDEKSMREVEKLLKSLGVPGGRRGAGTNAVKRGIVSWTLASIGDGKSAKFVREELLDGLEHVTAFWVAGMHAFWTNVAACCDGDRKKLADVEGGVRAIAGFARGAQAERGGEESPVLQDEARKGRDGGGFEPKGEDLLGE